MEMNDGFVCPFNDAVLETQEKLKIHMFSEHEDYLKKAFGLKT